MGRVFCRHASLDPPPEFCGDAPAAWHEEKDGVAGVRAVDAEQGALGGEVQPGNQLGHCLPRRHRQENGDEAGD